VEAFGKIRIHEKQIVKKKFSFEVLNSRNNEMLRFEWDGDSGTVSIGDRQISLDSIRFSDNCYSLLINGQSFDVSVHELNGACQVLVNGKSFEVILRDPKRLRKGTGSAEDSAGPVAVFAPMPGKVVKLLVQVGTKVQEGQGVAVVEAMKMQNEVNAPKSGVVEKILVEENQPVIAGESLLIVK
jgi:biotin carboxyl carrier protein